jgi:hypothetical protein
MNEETQTPEEESFDAIPPEVQEYIYSDEFSDSLQKLFSDIALTPDNQVLLKGALFGFLAQINDEETLLAAITTIVPDATQQQKVKNWIDTNISQKILALITDAYIHADDDDVEEDQTIPASTGTITTTPTALATLADRLKSASIATPEKRDLSLSTDNTPTSAPRAIDPYHESIDNE